MPNVNESGIGPIDREPPDTPDGGEEQQAPVLNLLPLSPRPSSEEAAAPGVFPSVSRKAEFLRDAVVELVVYAEGIADWATVAVLTSWGQRAAKTEKETSR